MAPLQGPAASLRVVGGSGVLRHIEAEGSVRLMIDDAKFLTELHGEPPRPGNIAGFAVLFGAPFDVDEAARRVADAGQTVVTDGQIRLTNGTPVEAKRP